MNIKKILYKALEESFLHNGYSFDDLTLTFSNRPEEADFQCNSAFAIAKKVHANPEVVANSIIANLYSLILINRNSFWNRAFFLHSYMRLYCNIFREEGNVPEVLQYKIICGTI